MTVLIDDQHDTDQVPTGLDVYVDTCVVDVFIHGGGISKYLSPRTSWRPDVLAKFSSSDTHSHIVNKITTNRD